MMIRATQDGSLYLTVALRWLQRRPSIACDIWSRDEHRNFADTDGFPEIGMK